MSTTFEDKLANLKSHLIMVKSLKESEQQQEFYLLLQKAKQTLGDVSPYMANFYLQYGSFLLQKLEKNMDMLNAGAVPEGQRQQQFDQIPEVFEDQSQQYQNGANLEKVQKTQEKQQKQQKVQYENEDIKITQDANDYQQIKQIKEKQENGSVKQLSQKGQEQEKLDDIEIAYENFQAALNIFKEQRRKISLGENSILTEQQIQKNIIVLHRRLGNLYMVDEHYPDAINEYHAVIKLQSQREGCEYNRKISQAHYNIGNCLLHDNKQNCETLAIKEYIESIKILVKNMQVEMNYDTLAFQLPTQNKVKVDRFAYLTKPGDSERVQETKEVISLLLDKIQDTFEQIGFRKSYQAEKMKMNQQKQQNTFKEVSKDVKVTNLGSFGNRKKAAVPIPAAELIIMRPSCPIKVDPTNQIEKQSTPTAIKICTLQNIDSQKPSQSIITQKPNQNAN